MSVSLQVVGTKAEGLEPAGGLCVYVCVSVYEVERELNPVSVFKGSFYRPSIECLWGFDLMRGDGSGVV